MKLKKTVSKTIKPAPHKRVRTAAGKKRQETRVSQPTRKQIKAKS
jgi:hypothetical protein